MTDHSDRGVVVPDVGAFHGRVAAAPGSKTNGAAPHRDLRDATLYLAFASLWILASDRLLTLFSNDPDILTRISTVKGIAFVIITTLLLYLLLRTRRVTETAAELAAAPGLGSLFAVLLSLALIVPLIGFGIVRLHGPQLQKGEWANVASIADLKASQVESWLHERHSEGDALAGSVGFIENIDRWRQTGDPRARANFLNRLELLKQAHSFEVELLDVDGRRMLAEDARPDSLDTIRQTLLPMALRNGQVQMSDLYRDSGGQIRLDYVVPLMLHTAVPPRTVGAVVLRAPVERFLFPLIQTWPTQSQSAEMMLVRRDGDQVLFLNELRHRKGTALSYRLPLDDPELPVAIALRSTATQMRQIEGTDYRGVSVLAAARPVQGTSWQMVAQVDRDEVMAPVRALVFWVSVIAFAAISTVTAAVLLLWRQRQRVHRLEMIVQAAEKDGLLKLFYDLPFVGMAITSPTTHQWLHVNDCLCAMLGYTREELLERTWVELVHPDEVAGCIAEFQEVLAGAIDAFQLDKRYIRKDGTVIDARLDVKCVRRQDGSVDLVIAMLQDITTRKRAEALLRESESRYRSLFENMLEGYALCRMLYEHDMPQDFIYIDVNKAFETVTGLKNVIGRKVSEVIPGIRETDPELFEIYGRVVMTGKPERFEMHVDALGMWFSVSVYSPAPEHFIAIFDNINERKRAEHALMTSELKLRTVLDGAADAVFVVNPESRFTYVNLQASALLGYSREELLGRDFLGGVAKPDVEQALAAFQEVMVGRGHVRVELQLARKDGRRVSVELNAVLLPDGNAYGSCRDITERKKADENLQIAAAAFESQEGMVVTDTASVILRVNRAFSEITGYAAEEVIGKTPAVLRSGRHDIGFYRDLWAKLRNAGYWHGEIWNRRKDGDVYPVWLSISAVKDSQGRETHYVGAFFDITERKEAEKQIRSLAFHDALTQLPNRRLLQDRLAQARVAAQRTGLYGALLFIDLDHFKSLNDTRGHDVGDQLLIAVARRCTDCVRESDTVARLGGDEFVVMCDRVGADAGAAAAHAEAIAEKIRGAVAKPFSLIGNSGQRIDDYEITCSIGISLFGAHEGAIDDPFQRADVAMYQAKDAGRNAVRFFEQAMQADLELRAATTADLRRALPSGQLQLFYQVQVDRELRYVGAEALLRWNHPARGCVAPADFIPLAEETGIILPIGQWVTEEACARLKAWSEDAATANLALSVNVSARQFRERDLIDRVRYAIGQSGIAPGRLKLELTESVVLDNIDDSILKMKALKGLGVGISIDDFGTGHSSLSYLKRLPIDELKIDRSFVRDLTIDRDDAAIVRAILGMARHFDLAVVAEGVETRAQFEFLLHHRCHAFQGYLFGRPAPAAQFESTCRAEMAHIV